VSLSSSQFLLQAYVNRIYCDCHATLAIGIAVPVPEQPQKVKASKLCKNARKIAAETRPGASPPRKQQRLGRKPVKTFGKQGSGQAVSGSQVGKSQTEMAAVSAAPQIPDSSQLSTSFSDRFASTNKCLSIWTFICLFLKKLLYLLYLELCYC